MNTDLILNSHLFKGCNKDELDNIFNHLDFKIKTYIKSDVILSQGNTTSELGFVMSGSVRIENVDFSGNMTVLSIVSKGGVFAESYALVGNEPLLINAIANENCEVIFIDVNKLFCPCTHCTSRHIIIENLLHISAKKNMELSKRNLHIGYKTIRERLLSYLSYQSLVNKSLSFTIPFNRQQLADYLNLDRSALSKELGKMKRDGILEYKKNYFKLSNNVIR